MKIINLMQTNWQSPIVLAESFFDYLSAGITETENIEEADVLFSFIFKLNPVINIPNMDANILSNPFNWENIESLPKIIEVLREKPRILFFDPFGEGKPDQHNTYPDFVRDADIPIATVPLPEHPNAYTTQFIDSRRFYINDRRERIPKSVIMIQDHLTEALADTLASLLESGDISVLTITHAHFDSFGSEVKQILEPHKDKLQCVNTTWPDGIRKLLNERAFVLNARTDVGTELMGLEGGFCGCQPIYPDTAYYKAHFGDELGIAYIDPKDVDGSLTAVIRAEHDWEQHRSAFVEHFSASKNLPAFWEHVKNVVSN